MKRCQCGETFSLKRAALGYATCLECGALDAEKLIQHKAQSIAPAYNKGAYQYVPNRQVAKDVGK